MPLGAEDGQRELGWTHPVTTSARERETPFLVDRIRKRVREFKRSPQSVFQRLHSDCESNFIFIPHLRSWFAYIYCAARATFDPLSLSLSLSLDAYRMPRELQLWLEARVSFLLAPLAPRIEIFIKRPRVDEILIGRILSRLFGKASGFPSCRAARVQWYLRDVEIRFLHIWYRFCVA